MNQRAGLFCAALSLAWTGCTDRQRVAPVPPDATGPLPLKEARQYVLDLVNRDRTAHDLEPVEWDKTAELAGQRHAEDMARHGFTAHWGSDGSVPEDRYSDAGGMHFVQENAACFFDGQVRELDPDPVFQPAMLDKVQSAFINETPPNDGHRQNILKPVHNKLGIGLAKPVGINEVCMAQEFLDAYGDYDDLPKKARVKQNIRIRGEVKKPVQFFAVGLARLDPPKPTPAAKLNKTSTYRLPDPYVLFFPEGFKTPKPVKVDGGRFEIEVPLDDRGRLGRYQVSIWGKYPDGGDAGVQVSLRTIVVR